ncbi:MAG: prolipoprotein diacylglyceryl transferase [Oscillospiraceae bacterium]|jgi:phosphatidylglycerol:prolipoprotein diacylglycerol transferase|nr:prolipoprotein diacylglyceryl transferase [Oscillospiraceae bacterium]
MQVNISFPGLGIPEFSPPSYFNIFGIHIALYGVIIALGFALVFLYVYKRRSHFGISTDALFDLIIWTMIGGIVGARLYYIAFNPGEYFGPGKWINIIKLREGGLAIYGGIILGGTAGIICAKIKKLNLLKACDAGGLGLLIGQSVGRWGNFFNREAYGGLTDLPWRMGLTGPNGTAIYVHPTFLYESLWNVLGFVLLHFYSRSKKQKFNGEIALLYIFWYGVGRSMIEGLRTDSLYIGNTNIRISQCLAIASAIAAGALWVLFRVKFGKQPQKSEEKDAYEQEATPTESADTEAPAETAAEAAIPAADTISETPEPESTADAAEQSVPDSKESD